MSDESNDLGSEERDALRSLAGEGAHSRALEDRVVKALRKQGLIQGSTPPWVRAVRVGGVLIAVALAFFVGTRVANRHREADRTPAVVPADRVPESEGSGTLMATAFHMEDGVEADLPAAGKDLRRSDYPEPVTGAAFHRSPVEVEEAEDGKTVGR
jgi:hypothetical protein